MSDMIKGTMISYRPDIKVLDATIRDGGLVNNFEFTDDFVRKLYLTNLRAGVDIMEIGYLADPELFEESKFGKWKFCHEDAIRKVLGDILDPKMPDFAKDFHIEGAHFYANGHRIFLRGKHDAAVWPLCLDNP